MSAAASPYTALPWLVATAFFMQTLDATILNTALPAMARDLDHSPLQMHAVVVAYMLTVALLIPLSGWLADRFGSRRVFMSAIALFSAGSLLCALAPSLGALVLARVIQGAGGALMLPVGRLAILRAFPRDRLLGVLAFVTIPGLLGPLIGPALGGWLVDVASWHWVFLINLPVGALGLLASLRWMPDLRGGLARFDVAGFVLFGAGMVLVSLALQGVGERALSTAASLLLVVSGLACLTGYWLHAARTPGALFSLALFRIPTFSVGILGNLFARIGSGAMPYLMPLYLQIGLDYSPTRAGLFLVPAALGAMSAKALAERLIRHFGYRRLLVGNTLAQGLLIATFALHDATTADGVLLAHLTLYGIVASLQFTAMNTLALIDLGDDTAAAGNSLLSVVMQLSMSLGVAAAAMLLAAFGGTGEGAAHAVIDVFRSTFACVGLLSMLSSIVFMQLGRDEGARGSRITLSGDE
ncbi:multidrug transporter subunit MdtD [Methyloversatilis thermotolerans]|uniref:multidrug transporter subunit MdtD n=1 Tax=Methyloversatilis thermotolerans TaxID=1346290 RepID=UPI00037B09D3|nr:multidrug transporter subunit MdtD [Methyloversatilis thermotolerans]